MPDTSPVLTILSQYNVPDSVRADAWDAFHGTNDPDAFHKSFQSLNLPDEAKARLWDIKFPGPSTIQATHPSIAQRLFNWADQKAESLRPGTDIQGSSDPDIQAKQKFLGVILSGPLGPGPAQVASGAIRMATGENLAGRNAQNPRVAAAGEVLQGAMSTMGPLGMMTDPVVPGATIAYSAAGSVAQRGLEKAGVSPEVSNLVVNLGMLAGPALGARALRGAHPAALPESLTTIKPSDLEIPEPTPVAKAAAPRVTSRVPTASEPVTPRPAVSVPQVAEATPAAQVAPPEPHSILAPTFGRGEYEDAWKPTEPVPQVANPIGAQAPAPNEIIAQAGLVPKGELFQGSGVFQMEHPNHPGKTSAIDAPFTVDQVQARMNETLSRFGADPNVPESVEAHLASTSKPAEPTPGLSPKGVASSAPAPTVEPPPQEPVVAPPEPRQAPLAEAVAPRPQTAVTSAIPVADRAPAFIKALDGLDKIRQQFPTSMPDAPAAKARDLVAEANAHGRAIPAEGRQQFVDALKTEGGKRIGNADLREKLIRDEPLVKAMRDQMAGRSAFKATVANIEDVEAGGKPVFDRQRFGDSLQHDIRESFHKLLGDQMQQVAPGEIRPGEDYWEGTAPTPGAQPAEYKGVPKEQWEAFRQERIKELAGIKDQLEQRIEGLASDPVHEGKTQAQLLKQALADEKLYNGRDLSSEIKGLRDIIGVDPTKLVYKSKGEPTVGPSGEAKAPGNLAVKSQKLINAIYGKTLKQIPDNDTLARDATNDRRTGTALQRAASQYETRWNLSKTPESTLTRRSEGGFMGENSSEERAARQRFLSDKTRDIIWDAKQSGGLDPNDLHEAVHTALGSDLQPLDELNKFVTKYGDRSWVKDLLDIRSEWTQLKEDTDQSGYSAVRLSSSMAGAGIGGLIGFAHGGIPGAIAGTAIGALAPEVALKIASKLPDVIPSMFATTPPELQEAAKQGKYHEDLPSKADISAYDRYITGPSRWTEPGIEKGLRDKGLGLAADFGHAFTKYSKMRDAVANEAAARSREYLNAAGEDHWQGTIAHMLDNERITPDNVDKITVKGQPLPNQIVDTYKAARAHTEDLRVSMRDGLRNMGREAGFTDDTVQKYFPDNWGIENGYYPHAQFGEYGVLKKAGDGLEPLETGWRFRSLERARQASVEYQKLNPGAELTTLAGDGAKAMTDSMRSRMVRLAEAINSGKHTEEELQDMASAMAFGPKAAPRKAFGSAIQRAANLPGWDPSRATFQQYTVNAARWSVNTEARQVFMNMRNDFAKQIGAASAESPAKLPLSAAGRKGGFGVLAKMDQSIQAFEGYPTMYQNWMRAGSKALNLDPMAAERVMNAVKQTSGVLKVGLTPFIGALHLAQLKDTANVVGLKDTLIGAKEFANGGWKTYKPLLDQLGIRPQAHEPMMEDATTYENAWSKVGKGVETAHKIAMAPLSYPVFTTRAITAISSFVKDIKAGMPRDAAMQRAGEVVDRVLGNFSPANRSTLELKAPPSTLMFKRWALQQMQFATGLHGSEIPKYIVGLSLLGGASMLPFAQDINDAYKWLTGKDVLAKAAANPKLGPLVRGVSGELGADITNRNPYSEVTRFTDSPVNLAGPVAGDIARGVEAGLKTGFDRGTSSQQTAVRQFERGISPPATRLFDYTSNRNNDPGKNIFTDTGTSRNSLGEPILDDLTPSERTRQALNIRPPRVAQQAAAHQLDVEAKAREKDVMNGATNDFVDGLMRNDDSKMDRALDTVDKLGPQYRSGLTSAIRARMKAMQLNQEQRDLINSSFKDRPGVLEYYGGDQQ